MPIGQRTRCRVFSEIFAQPIFLRTAPKTGVDITVERNDVPSANVVAVITSTGGTGIPAKVVKIRRSLESVVVVISGCGASTTTVPAPCRLVTFFEIIRSAARVGMVTHREHYAGNAVEELGRRCGLDPIATRNIASAH